MQLIKRIFSDQSLGDCAPLCILMSLWIFRDDTVNIDESVMMMMIAHNSFVRQKEVAQEEEEEEAGGRRKAGSIGIPTPGVDAPIGPTKKF